MMSARIIARDAKHPQLPHRRSFVVPAAAAAAASGGLPPAVADRVVCARGGNGNRPTGTRKRIRTIKSRFGAKRGALQRALGDLQSMSGGGGVDGGGLLELAAPSGGGPAGGCSRRRRLLSRMYPLPLPSFVVVAAAVLISASLSVLVEVIF